MAAFKKNILGTSVFKASFLIGLFMSLIVAAGVVLYAKYRIDKGDRFAYYQLNKFNKELLSTFEQEGREALIEEVFVIRGKRILTPYLLGDVVPRRRFVGTYYSGSDEVVAGFPGFDPTYKFALQRFKFNNIEPLMWLRLQRLPNDERYVIAMLADPQRPMWTSVMWFWSFIIFLSLLSFATIQGLFLSHKVVSRIGAIVNSQTNEEDVCESRLISSSRGDEFDQLTEALNRRLDDFQDVATTLESNTDGIAHEIRTPLTNINGTLELMHEDISDPEALKKHLFEIEESQLDLTKILDALLRLGEIRGGDRKSSFRRLDLSDIASRMVDAYQPSFSDNRKEFFADIVREAHIVGDAELIEQMISNLYENALMHSRVAAQVTTTLEYDDETVRLTIGDDGPGIPRSIQKAVFSRFFRGTTDRSKPGSGLGLSIVKAIVELHDATIELEKDSSGAVFAIVFPRA